MRVDGRAIARKIYRDLDERVSILNKKGIVPHLVIILIGNDPASKSYIRQKIRRAGELGIRVTFKRFPKHTAEKTVVRYIDILNSDNTVHGVIVQRPLPAHFNPEVMKRIVLPAKDVDGFHPESSFDPPLAQAVMRILQEVYSKQSGSPSVSLAPSATAEFDPVPFKKWLTSKNIVIMGKGEAGGKPVISHIEKLGVEHQIVHSQTEKPEEFMKGADLIISAVGKENVIKPEDLKKGTILVGIGLHKEKDARLHGDYDEAKIQSIASFYTPTPGGVGPVNVAMLLKNAVDACYSS